MQVDIVAAGHSQASHFHIYTLDAKLKDVFTQK